MFDINRSPFDECGERDEEAAGEYQERLANAFAEAPEGQAYLAEWGQLGWSHFFLEYGISYRGEIPPEMDRGSIEEIVFELFPRKVSTEPEAASAAIAELRCFWRFLQREYNLPNATQILRALEPPAEKRLQSALSDPSNFGIAKSIVMRGKNAGFDMSTPEGSSQFMAAYNESRRLQQSSEVTSERFDPSAAVPPPRTAQQTRRKTTITAGHLSPQQRRERDKDLRRRLKRRKRK